MPGSPSASPPPAPRGAQYTPGRRHGPGPPEPHLAAASDGADAWGRLAAHLTGGWPRRPARAHSPAFMPNETPCRPAPGRAIPSPWGTPSTSPGPVRFATRCPATAGDPAEVDPGRAAQRRLDVPAYAVRYAHAHAVSALRQAADLGLGLGEAAEFGPRLLAHPSELVLLDELSWLPERVAGAARRACRTPSRATLSGWPGRTSTARSSARRRGRAWRRAAARSQPASGWLPPAPPRCARALTCSAWTRQTRL